MFSDSGDAGFSTANTTNGGTSREDYNMVVPDEFKEKPWMTELLKNQDPYNELLKQHDNLQRMIGTDTVRIPDEKSTDEQKNNFYKKLGVPESVDGYKIENVNWTDEEKPFGEIIDKGRVPEIVNSVVAEAHRLKVTPAQLNGIISTFERAQAKFQSQELMRLQQEQQELGKDFAVLGAQTFGNKYQQVMSNAKTVIGDLVPDSLKLHLNQMDNKSLMVLAAAIDSIHQRYTREDTVTHRATPGSNTNLIDSTKELMNRPEYSDTDSAVYKQVVTNFKEMDRLNIVFK